MTLSPTGSTANTKTVTVILRDDVDISSRFQVVAYDSTGETAPRPIYTCRTQGDVVSWLVCNGYKWLQDSRPQLWVKS
jgi:hypothetical protein